MIRDFLDFEFVSQLTQLMIGLWLSLSRVAFMIFTLVLFCIQTAIAGDSVANPLAKPQTASFSGEFTSDDISASIKYSEFLYEGKIEFNNQSFPLTAMKNGERLIGSFESNGEAFPLEGRLKGADTLILSTADTEFTLKRITVERNDKPDNPLAKNKNGSSNPLDRSKSAAPKKLLIQSTEPTTQIVNQKSTGLTGKAETDTGNEYVSMDDATAFREGYQIAREVMLETARVESAPEYTTQELHTLLNENYQTYDQESKEILASMRTIWDEMVLTWDSMGVENQWELMVWFHGIGSQFPSLQAERKDTTQTQSNRSE